MSVRKQKAFVAINCAAIPENLLESELFGYAKGAFSGATRAKAGLLAEADGGTLFLDEIGDMPLPLQAKLLRLLESRKYRPVGGKEEVASDFRLVAATHVHLKKRVEKGEFRSDLFYRLNQYPLYLPSLVERKEDLQELVAHFVRIYNERQGCKITGVRYAVLQYLREYDFPGNVRELRNIVEYACAQTPVGEEIDVIALKTQVLEDEEGKGCVSLLQKTEGQAYSQIKNLRQALLRYETAIIKSRLAQYDGNKAKAATSLSLPLRTLAHKCRKLEIQ